MSPAAHPPPTRDELLDLVPTIALYHREPLPDDQNALSYWGEAAAALIEPDEDLLECCLESGSCGADGQRTPRPLDAPTVERLQAFANANQRVFDLLHAGVACGRVQFPEFEDEGGSIAEHAESLGPFRRLARAWLVLARLLIAEHRYADAARELTALGEMGHLLCCGESFQMDYLVGMAVLGLATVGIRELAVASDVPAAARAVLASAVARWLAEADEMVQCFRVELCSYAVPEIVRLTCSRDVKDLLDQLLERHFGNAPLVPEEDENAARDDDGRLAWRRDSMLYLLDGHPNPWDPIATIRALGQLTADRIAGLQEHGRFGPVRFWRRVGRVFRERRLRARMRSWPTQFQAVWPYECLGVSDDAQRQRAEFQEHFTPRQWAEQQPPSKSQLATVRRRLRTIPNALGWLVVDALWSVDITPIEHQRRAELHALRRVLAV
jgi:hypothetical protein